MKYVLVLVSIISAALASQPAQSQIASSIGVFLNQTEKALQNFTGEIAREQCSAANSQNLSIKECFDYSFNYTKKIYLQYKPIAIKTINDAAHNVDGTYFIIDEKSGSGILKGNPAVKVDDAVSANTNILVSRLKKVLDDIISQDEGTGLKRRGRFSFLGNIFGKGGSTAIDDIAKAPKSQFSGHSVEPPRHQTSCSSPNSFDDVSSVGSKSVGDSSFNSRPQSFKTSNRLEDSTSHFSSPSRIKPGLFDTVFKTKISRAVFGFLIASGVIFSFHKMFQADSQALEDSANQESMGISATDSSDYYSDPYYSNDPYSFSSDPYYSSDPNSFASDTFSSSTDSLSTDASESQYPDIFDEATGYHWKFDSMAGQYYRIDDATQQIIYYQG